MFSKRLSFYRRPHEAINEFSGLGKFSDIHRYFRDKYKEKRFGHHDDFYERFMHFIATLIGILNGDTLSFKIPQSANRYKIQLEALRVKTLTREELLEYIRTVSIYAKNARTLDSSDALFYQRLIGRILVPALNVFAMISDQEFEAIISQIPGEILLAEQEFAVRGERFSEPIFPNIFFQLKKSYSPAIIDRCIKTLSRFPVGSNDRYQYCLNVLKEINGDFVAATRSSLEVSRGDDLEPIVSPAKYEDMDDLILRMLSESPCLENRAKAEAFGKKHDLGDARRNATGSLSI